MSTLAAYQRAMVSLAFAEDDARPHIPGFELYRDMIRARLFAMAKVAYERSFDAHCFARYLADRPPASPFIREVIAGFGPYAEREASGLRVSLLRFETAKWQVASLPYPASEAGELDFEARLVVNPTLLRVPLEHVVTEDERAEAHILLVYRRPDDHGVLWSRLPRVAALLADEAPKQKLSERVAAYFARGVDTADEAGLTRLADELMLAVERGIVLGTEL
ncbi:MAG TPA: hypothetical protein VFX59_10345 [Polyangiales bacterium]|nr:hypothetical protein [Polyangiales bacterium]